MCVGFLYTLTWTWPRILAKAIFTDRVNMDKHVHPPLDIYQLGQY